ncbi:MAG: substrate-binding domain-containing protein, partial [Clostridia bacterium]|nr:substrate-binding domain-containing protein [Clostridia bacterium]
MKKIISLLTVAVLLVCALTGCGGNKEAVATDGSTSMNKVIGALGEAFENETGITVTYNATGSGAGIQAVQEGRCDIGLASRNLKDEEKAKGL